MNATYAAMSKGNLIGIIESQKRIVNYQQEKLHWYEGIISNKALPITMRLATIAARRLEETRKPGEDGYFRAHLPDLADMVGVSPSTMSRGLKHLAESTEAIERITRPKEDEPYKELVFIRPTDLLNEPHNIKPVKEIKRHGGDHRIFCRSCGSDDIVEKKQHICRECGTVVKTFELRPINSPEEQEQSDPLQDAMGESTQEELVAGTDLPNSEESTDDPNPLQDAMALSALSEETTNVSDPLQDATITVNTVGAGDELQTLPQWVCWRYGTKRDKNGKRAKQPYDAKLEAPRSPCDYTDPATWTTFEEAQVKYEASQAWKGRPYDGIGFCFQEGGGIVGIDQDGSLDPRIDSYSELSPSETGIHTFARGSILRNVKQFGIELYDHDRFFTWTGKHLAGTPTTIVPRQAELDALFAEIAPPKEERQPTPCVFAPCPLTDEEVLEKARNARNGAKFTLLWEGNTKGYASQSEADLALCRLLAYWSDNDASVIDRLFRQSALYREKWDRGGRSGETYGEGTIRRAG